MGVALCVLLALMLVPAVTALRRSEAIYAEIRARQREFQDVQRVFEATSQSVFTVSITIREFLLDNSPQAGRMYRARLEAARDRLQADVNRLRRLLPPSETGVLQRLQHEVDAYLAVVAPVFDWTPDERVERGAYFLRQEQRPRRESILALADELADLNAALFAEQQRQTDEGESRFRRDLTRSVAFALLIGVAVSAVGILRMRALERRAADQQQRAEQTSEEMRSLSARLRQAQEDERRTISRELHDEVGQKLTAMRMELGALERLRASPERDFDTTLSEVKSLAEQSLRLVRDIAAGLRPSVLDDLGLDAALRKQAREFSTRTGTPVSVAVDAGCVDLNDRQRIYVYRIVQEALTNCAKHARAGSIAISLANRNGNVELTVGDDGTGFDPARIGHQGLGLIGIEERARELGGHLAVRSAPGEGTTIAVAIPRSYPR